MFVIEELTGTYIKLPELVACFDKNGDITGRMMDVTPDLAKALMHNAKYLEQRYPDESWNRNLAPRRVMTYGGTMLEGAWQENHQGPCLGVRDGDVVFPLDGNHRFAGVVARGVTVRMFVHFDPNHAVPHVLKVDVGYRRAADYVLGQHRAVVEVAKAITCMVMGRSVTETDAIAIFGDRTNVHAGRLSLEKRKIHTTSAVRAAYVVSMIMHPDRSDDLVRWYSQYILNAQDKPPSLHALYNHFEREASGVRGTRVPNGIPTSKERYAKTRVAIAATIDGRSISKIKTYRSSGTIQGTVIKHIIELRQLFADERDKASRLLGIDATKDDE